MLQAEWLDKCKKKLDVSSDYALAKELEISRMRISDYRKDKVKFDEYAYFKIGDILGISPIVIIAEIQVRNAKKPAKALFFKNYLTSVGLWITLAVIPLFLGSHSESALGAGKAAVIDIKTHYAKLKRLFQVSKKRHKCRIVYV